MLQHSYNTMHWSLKGASLPGDRRAWFFAGPHS